jgi:hypothetical protein
MATSTIDYSNTIIYKLRAKDPNIPDFYIGHSTNFESRKAGHKHCCNNWCDSSESNYHLKVYKFIRLNGRFKNWTFDILETANLKNLTEALKLETYYYDELEPSLNTVRPYISPEERAVYQIYLHLQTDADVRPTTVERAEYKNNLHLQTVANETFIEAYNEKYAYKNWYIANQDEIEAAELARRTAAKEKVAATKEYQREYRKETREYQVDTHPVKQVYKPITFRCNCGSTVHTDRLDKHLKTKFHMTYIAAKLN